ncbi:transposase [Jannaschia sp. M317]|uniref:transposase n=1 Tax=Jannaschia sp. M317 TaxID=2867011 RepID=UPI002202800B|nr:transposase [Jannaschia sp. M317]
MRAHLTIKALFGRSPRKTTGSVRSLQRFAGLEPQVSDFPTVRQRQKTWARAAA